MDIAVDGGGNVWTANGGISEFSSAGALLSPVPIGYQGGVTNSDQSVLTASPIRIAIDGSGNVWVAEALTANTGQVGQFLGLASPVVTPLIGPPSLP